jgi:plastocyanin domain-containing protein
MKRLFVVAVLLFCIPLLAGVAWCDDNPQKETVFKATIDKDGVQRVEMVGGSYFFRPNQIIVKVNVPVELKIRKESGIVPHDFVLKAPEAGIDVNLSLEDEPQTVRFTPTKTGSYIFYCDKKFLFFPSHREEGMKGTLEVIQ